MVHLKYHKKKICFVSPYGYNLYNEKVKIQFGGAEVQLFLISNELAKDKNFSVSNVLGDYRVKMKKIIIQNDMFLYFSQNLNNHIKDYFLNPIRLLITLVKINPDIIIQRSQRMDTFVCSFYSKIFRKKFIYSIAHDKEILKIGFNSLTVFLFPLSLLLSDFIVAQNSYQYNLIKKLNIYKHKKVKIIKSGYIIKEKQILKEKTNILWVGRAVKWKQPEKFLSIARLFPNHKFCMVCRESENKNYWLKIKNLANQISNLEFIDNVPFSQIDGYFQEAKAFINTSIQEGFPNTFIQAFLYKTPVISLNVNPNELFTYFQVGYFCHNNFNETISNLKELLTNNSVYEEFSENSYNYVIENHNIRKITNKWKKIIYQNLLPFQRKRVHQIIDLISM